MTPETQAEVVAAVAKWRPRLRLMEWAIGYEWEAEGVVIADCIHDGKRKRGVLRFAPDFLTIPKDSALGKWMTVEKAIVHELCHLVYSPLYTEAIDAVATARVGAEAERQINERLDDANEEVAEFLAKLFWEVYERLAWDDRYYEAEKLAGRGKQVE